MPSIQAPDHIHALLETLHKESQDQECALPSFSSPSMPRRGTPEFDNLMLDKFIALDQDKCEFVYQLLRAMRATSIVEAGTSYGVSTIYLALAAGQNREAVSGSKEARVIATEKEPTKAANAREYWGIAGDEVWGLIDLRVGDLRETLKRDVIGDVEFLLLDIWTPLALPTLRLVEAHFKPGAVVIVDNIWSAQAGYEEFFGYVNRPGSPYNTVTLPFKGGLGMIVYNP